MGDDLLIFVGGTAASFFPLYWLIRRFAGRLKSQARRSTDQLPVQDIKGEFIDLLRREALARVVATLDAAARDLHDASRADAAVLPRLGDETRQRIMDMKPLVGSLFPPEAAGRFDRHVARLDSASHSMIRTVRRENEIVVTELRATIPAGKPARVERPARQWRSLFDAGVPEVRA